jgi:hypothetical protein
MEEKHRMKVGREEVLVALWSSEACTESSYNGVLGVGLDSPETRGDGSSAGSVDVGIGKRRMCSHRCGAGDRILAGDGV